MQGVDVRRAAGSGMAAAGGIRGGATDGLGGPVEGLAELFFIFCFLFTEAGVGQPPLIMHRLTVTFW